MPEDDIELVERIRRGAPDHFAEVIRRYQPRVFGVLYRYERDLHRLEDLAQETFVKAWRSLAQFDGRAPFEHWLSRIAVNVALDHLRRRKRSRSEVAFSDLGDEVLETLRDPREREAMASEHARELLEYALRELSPAERVVITLQELEGRSVKEISALTGSSGVAVRVRAMRARAKLRKALERLEQETYERAKT